MKVVINGKTYVSSPEIEDKPMCSGCVAELDDDCCEVLPECCNLEEGSSWVWREDETETENDNPA